MLTDDRSTVDVVATTRSDTRGARGRRLAAAALASSLLLGACAHDGAEVLRPTVASRASHGPGTLTGASTRSRVSTDESAVRDDRRSESIGSDRIQHR